MKNAPLAAALLGVLLASSAYAQEIPPGVSLGPAPVDVTVGRDGTAAVTLKNGNLYRGELVERIQGEHVTLKLATGEMKTFAWNELAPAAAPPAPSAPPPPPQTSAPVAESGTLVTLDGDGVRLERLAGTATVSMPWGSGSWGYGHAEAYAVVCSTPCNRQVDTSSQYRLAGPGLVPTGLFAISGSTAHIEAHMASRAQRVGGWALFGVGLGVGAISFLIGGMCAELTSTAAATGSQLGGCPSSGWFVAGGIGVAVAIGGLVMALTASSSAVVNGDSVALRLSPHVALTPRGLVF